MLSSILFAEGVMSPLRQNTALSVGSASANFAKKIALQSGSSALTVPQESPHSASAIFSVLIIDRAELMELYSSAFLSIFQKSILSCGKMRHSWGTSAS